MTNEMILDLYDKVYDFTDELGDTALNILDEQLEARGVYDDFMQLIELYDKCPELSQSVLSKLYEAHEAALVECHDECE